MREEPAASRRAETSLPVLRTISERERDVLTTPADDIAESAEVSGRLGGRHPGSDESGGTLG